jgi:hypothetical protein
MEDNSTETRNIAVDDATLTFETARKGADEIAQERLEEPLLIAWHDGIAGKGHPDVQECTDKPGWQTYAESRGGKLTINVNSGKYVFVYSETSLNDI